ncbi:hypothetical protein LJR175_006001 [Variovorax sp. LjRoot175]|uniref:hypothetical protein n=1 Tax=Variovorax sp. LjRoot175 TaxID=3342276 RepID=UPI003ECE484E
MPAGLGWHPCHPLVQGAGPEHLSFAARHRGDPDAQGRVLHCAQAPVYRMNPGETAAFCGWAGELVLRVGPEVSIRVAGEDRHHLVLHRPRQGAYLCVAPVTVLPGRLGDEGLLPAAVLEPGESQRASWSCAALPR